MILIGIMSNRFQRAAYRNNNHPDNRNNTSGFRVVCPQHSRNKFFCLSFPRTWESRSS